ncbi:MAG: hypothetical protein KDA91_03745 [Planctomycetaceae bacterium]|nr:hypothetical protein [Planctomycetaceae bacterium]
MNARSVSSVLSGNNVRFSGQVVSLADRIRCGNEVPEVSVETDPETGDIIEINIRCRCGEQIVLDCHYDGEFGVHEDQSVA